LIFNFNNFHLFILRFNLYLLYGIDQFMSSENDLISKKRAPKLETCYNG